jgi:hypothetical protein
MRALRQLQKEEVIKVEHQAQHWKDITLITHLWYPAAE